MPDTGDAVVRKSKGRVRSLESNGLLFFESQIKKIFRSKTIMPSHIASTYFQIFEVTVAILAENTNSAL